MSAHAASSKVILITGATSGFGAACVRYLADRGYRVYGTGRRVELPSNDTETYPVLIPMDVRDDTSVRTSVDFVVEREGRIDVLVNNAGYGLAGAIEDTSSEEARDQFETNLFGVHRVCCCVLPLMRNVRSGLIVNVGSIGGLVTIPFQGFYCASKYALEAMTEALRMEVERWGIGVTLVEPGDFKTNFTSNRIFATASTASEYSESCASAVGVMEKDERHGSDPEAMAVLLERLIRKNDVRPRYVVGMVVQKLAVVLKRAFPASIFEKAIMAYYKV